MSSSRSIRRPVSLLAAIALLAGGGWLGWQGLHQPPLPTPSPEQTISVSPDEAIELAESGQVQAPVLPEGDFGEFVRMEPVPRPPAADGGSTSGTGQQDATWTNRLQIPNIYVDAPLTNLGVTDLGRMALPDDLRYVARLNTTAPLGADEGTTLLAGHVTWNRDHGALYFLGNVTAGSEVRTWDADGERTDWVVNKVKMYDKQALPDDIFDPNGKRQLAIVTCGGPIINLPNGGWTHEDNIVVVAVPKDAPDKPVEAAQQ